MEVKFIGQGLSLSNDKPAGDIINDYLEDNGYQEFSAFVAFASYGGINQIMSNLKELIERKGKVRLFIGVDQHGTSQEALELLLEEEIPTYIVHSPNRIVFHPKIYTFEGENQYFVIVGSSNLTTQGLYQNVEASLCVCSKYDEEEERGRELLSDIFDYYNDLINGASMTCRKLTREILEILVKAKVVLPDKVVRDVMNAHVKEMETAMLSDIETLNNTFQKLKTNKPKNLKKKNVKNEILESGDKDIMVHINTAEIKGDAMWIVTEKMTGGSRNILDLSKKGMLDGALKPGSVEFFGIEKDDYEQRKEISLVYNDKIYKNNTVLYGHGNSNWRIQIKGEAQDGSKMTDISKPKLGNYGGFQYKILVFEKTDVQDQFKLYILDESELDNLIVQSNEWAKGGNGTGRAYGFILS